MPTQYPDIFAALAAPFQENEVKVRQQAGRNLHYITARSAMNRLDAILGPENWWDEFEAAEHSVLCKLTIRLPDGSTLTKADAGGYAGMSDQGDDDKSGYSDAFKRAAVKFGVARYLYRDGVPEFVRQHGDSPELLPVLDAGPRQASPGAPQPGPRQRSNRDPGPRQAPADDGQDGARRTFEVQPPRSGRALFAWVKDQEQRHEVGLLQYLNKWGKLQDYPARMVDWDADQVANAYREAARKVQVSQGGEVDPEDAEIDRQAAREAR